MATVPEAKQLVFEGAFSGMPVAKIGRVAADKIFTIKGTLVLSGCANDMVNVSTLANGIYLIEIIGDKPRIAKFIKQ